jgi:1-deoxy-D-xylulose-5-phosphate reductoisomerase
MIQPGTARSSSASEEALPLPSPRSITILGATGSIGSSTLDLLRRERAHFIVEAVTAGRDVKKLAAIAHEMNARVAVVSDVACYDELKSALAGSGIDCAAGENALVEAAARPAEIVVAAITGAAGLRPTLAAIERSATVALANKESLVCAGAHFMRRAAATGASVLPVDSEHNAVFQALGAGPREDVKRAILTASGGPFRQWTVEQIATATPEQALRHPNWSMGAKVTIDSATLMNKGLELIEAHHLFALPSDQLDVLVHPQSIVHGLVEFRDGSVVAQLGAPDMRIPIAHCLAWPKRMAAAAPRLDLARIQNLSFEEPDLVRFPALRIAREALEAGGAAPTVLNAADEIAVAAFIGGKIGFAGIAVLAARTLAETARRGLTAEPSSVDEALGIDRMAREISLTLLPEIAAKAS